jgi:hypothetical protein
VRGWSWYDQRDGRRTTVATFLTRESAEEQLAGWKRYTAPMRPDLHELLSFVEVRAIGDEE